MDTFNLAILERQTSKTTAKIIFLEKLKFTFYDEENDNTINFRSLNSSQNCKITTSSSEDFSELINRIKIKKRGAIERELDRFTKNLTLLEKHCFSALNDSLTKQKFDKKAKKVQSSRRNPPLQFQNNIVKKKAKKKQSSKSILYEKGITTKRKSKIDLHKKFQTNELKSNNQFKNKFLYKNERSRLNSKRNFQVEEEIEKRGTSVNVPRFKFAFYNPFKGFFKKKTEENNE